jgi:hypothetical protein
VATWIASCHHYNLPGTLLTKTEVLHVSLQPPAEEPLW